MTAQTETIMRLLSDTDAILALLSAGIPVVPVPHRDDPRYGSPPGMSYGRRQGFGLLSSDT